MDSWALNMPPEFWEASPLELARENHRVLIRCFAVKSRSVVLASNNDLEREVNERICEELQIPILKRKGGGGTVYLAPGAVVLTLAFQAKHYFNNKRYFFLINQAWIDGLESFGIKNLTQKGISDLAVGEKKIAGTSLFRSRHLVLFQGSLLVDFDPDFMEKVLKHPSREPDYRGGRSHKDFLTSLKNLGYNVDPEKIAVFCENYLKKNIFKYLKDDFL